MRLVMTETPTATVPAQRRPVRDRPCEKTAADGSGHTGGRIMSTNELALLAIILAVIHLPPQATVVWCRLIWRSRVPFRHWLTAIAFLMMGALAFIYVWSAPGVQPWRSPASMVLVITITNFLVVMPFLCHAILVVARGRTRLGRVRSSSETSDKGIRPTAK